MRVRAMALVLALIVIGACGADEPDHGAEPTLGSTASSPFTVGAPPTGFELVTAGTGTQRQAWGDDSFGNDDPFTVLAPEGADATSPDIVVVSVTGFAGYQGGLGQASRGIDGEHFQVDGRPAIFQPTRSDTTYWHWADLVVQRAEDLAVRVTARDATKDELLDVVRQVQPSEDHLRAPEVPNPPNGLHVVGSVDADVVIGLSPQVAAHSDAVPGTPAAHGVGWVDGTNSIAVMTLPGRAATIAALPGFAAFRQRENFAARSLVINGRPAIVITSLPDVEQGWGYRAVLTQSEWGDVVMVSALTLPLAPSGSSAGGDTTDQVLIDLAASVRPADDAAWEQVIETALGGPGLQPDPGAVEVVRGQAGGLEWLLQAREQPDMQTQTHPAIPIEGVQVDTCLKLSNRKRICASQYSSGLSDDLVFNEPTTVRGARYDFDFPSFVIVSAPTAASQVRVTTTAETKTVALAPVPGTNLRAGVAMVERPGDAKCSDDWASQGGGTGGLEPMRVDGLDDAGTAIACFGWVFDAP